MRCCSIGAETHTTVLLLKFNEKRVKCYYCKCRSKLAGGGVFSWWRMKALTVDLESFVFATEAERMYAGLGLGCVLRG